MQSESVQLSSILGVDIGGTFTDIVYYIPPSTADFTGQLIVHKLPSTPKNPSQGLLTGMQDLDVARECVIIHGSTVATNALLERKGARTALIPGKVTFDVRTGDILSIYSPGGGGYLIKEQENEHDN